QRLADAHHGGARGRRQPGQRAPAGREPTRVDRARLSHGPKSGADRAAVHSGRWARGRRGERWPGRSSSAVPPVNPRDSAQRPRWGWHACALGVTLAAATSLITLPPVPPPPAPAAPISPTQRGQDPIIIPGVLPDGSPYTPLYVLPSGTSLGQAPNQDGGRLRLVERAADGKVRVLRQLPVANTPQYVGFTEAEGEIGWAESLAGDREGRTEIWAVTPES